MDGIHNFEHHVFYDGLDRQGEVSHKDVANKNRS
jgi:hypothetical protein